MGNTMRDESGSLLEWVIPLLFVVCAGWATWHTSAFILDVFPPDSESLFGQISEQHIRKDFTPNLPGLFGGYADVLDWAALLLLPIIFFFGVRTLRHAKMERENPSSIDKIALFVGRVIMMLIVLMSSVMLYEVFLRYVFDKPTLWANELTLWLAGYVFLCSGFYAMQQRCHIRIFLLYDVVPRWLQHLFDCLSVLMICGFAIALIFGSYKQVFITKFQRWEMFGSAFDPPIPATVQPMILVIVALIAIQAVINLIADWNEEPERHLGVDDLDADDIEAMKRSVGSN